MLPQHTVVDMQALGGEHVPAKLGEDGVEGCDASADPVSERRDVELDALAGEGCALPVQRQMVAELADQDHGEQARAGKAAWDRMRRRRRLADASQSRQAELLAHPLDDLPAPRLAFEIPWGGGQRPALGQSEVANTNSGDDDASSC